MNTVSVHNRNKLPSDERSRGRSPLRPVGLGRIAIVPATFGTFRRWKVPRRRLCICFCQPERGFFQNPQFQPHILFSSRRKENVPLTVQEKRAARGIAIPQDPQETGECSADGPVHQMTLPPEHCRAVLASCTLDGIPGDGGTSAAFTNKTWSHIDRRCLP